MERAAGEALCTAIRGLRRQLRALGEPDGPDSPAARWTQWLVLERAGSAWALTPGELAEHLPGFIPPQRDDGLLRVLTAALRPAALEPCWREATVLGWIHQFWNDEEREALDARIGPRGKLRVEQLATKTQLFSERYMVDWLVQNALGRVWLELRAARGWRGPSVVERWPYFVAPPRLDVTSTTPRSATALRVLDPCCGTGHFLVGLLDALVQLHEEEATALGSSLGRDDALDRCLRFNLHGVDIDARAVRVAAATLWLRARQLGLRRPLPPLWLAATQPASSLGGSAAPPSDDLAWHWRHAAWLGCLLRLPPPATAPHPLEPTETHELGVHADAPTLPRGERLRWLLGEGRYHAVLGNPPYLATSKLRLDADARRRALGEQPDLLGAVLLRALELCAPGGRYGFVTLSNWMVLSSFEPLRRALAQTRLELVADLGKGAFRHASKLIQSALFVGAVAPPGEAPTLGLRAGSVHGGDVAQTERLESSLRAQRGHYSPFAPSAFAVIDGAPLLHGLPSATLQQYAVATKLGALCVGRGGIATGDNERYLRARWELPPAAAARCLPYLKGADGEEWFAPERWLLRAGAAWPALGLAKPALELELPDELGVAYTTIGTRFGARRHAGPAIRDVSGASLFPRRVTLSELLCALNRSPARELALALNPTVNFQLGDVLRLPFHRVPEADHIVAELEHAFLEAERADERSALFEAPQPQRYAAAKRWAQAAVDRPLGAPLEALRAPYVPPSAEARFSFAVGRALGRFPAQPAAGRPWLIVSEGAEAALTPDQARLLRAAWAPELPGGHLEEHLRLHFFEAHLRRHSGRPLYFPLCSAQRRVVVFVHWHAWRPDTLARIDREGLAPLLGRLEQRGAPAPWRAELAQLRRELAQLRERGPDSPAGVPAREVDAPYLPCEADGSRLNAAPLWRLVHPLWKEPQRLWVKLARGTGSKPLDWAGQAARYFPERVRSRAAQDPSLAAEHGWLQELHPELARAPRRRGTRLRP